MEKRKSTDDSNNKPGPSASSAGVQQCNEGEFKLDVNQSDDLLKFADLTAISSTYCYIKTKFHLKFYSQINEARLFEREKTCFFSGIEGIGKTSTLIRYVLDCFEKKDYSVHYVDLMQIEMSKKKWEEFTTYAKNFKNMDCLIIDHTTAFNMHLVQMFKLGIEVNLKIILVETGFTSSVRLQLSFGKSWQMDEEEFENLWIKTFRAIPNVCEKRCKDLIGSGKEIYNHYSKEGYLITPRLLHFVWCRMYIRGQSIKQSSAFYENEKKNKINEFVEIQDDNSVFSKFLLHTRTFLHHIPENGDLILHRKEFHGLRIAVSIFDIELKEVSKDDIKTDARFLNLGMEEGDLYVRMSHLIPRLTKYWREKLPYTFEAVIDNSSTLLSIMFQKGGGQKEIENLIVESQQIAQSVIVSEMAEETLYYHSSECTSVPQTSEVQILATCYDFYSVDLDDLEKFNSLVSELRCCEKNVAKCAHFLKENMKEKTFLLYPEIGNLMGVDYFVYCPDKRKHAEQPKVPRRQNTIFMVQVSMGQSHVGNTIGRALNILKNVLGNADLLFHVVVLIATAKTGTYALTKCKLKNVSVINLKNGPNSLKRTLEKPYMLNKFLNQVFQNSKKLCKNE